METNYILILVATVAQFILGALWYSPVMFGKWWMQIMEAENIPKDEMKRMQKQMAPFYIVQFLITLVSTFVLALFINTMPVYNVYGIALLILAGFIVPTQIGGVIWANTKRKFWFKQIFVMATYQLVSLMLAVFILTM